jgi:hypothetical protein
MELLPPAAIKLLTLSRLPSDLSRFLALRLPFSRSPILPLSHFCLSSGNAVESFYSHDKKSIVNVSNAKKAALSKQLTLASGRGILQSTQSKRDLNGIARAHMRVSFRLCVHSNAYFGSVHVFLQLSSLFSFTTSLQTSPRKVHRSRRVTPFFTSIAPSTIALRISTHPLRCSFVHRYV